MRLVHYERVLAAIVVATAVLDAALIGTRARAAEPDGPNLALAMQSLLVEAIARSEKSVVAVARVRKPEREATAGAPGGPLPSPFLPQFMSESSPTSEDFVPNGFGAGVAIDSGLILTSYHVIGDVDKSEYYVWGQHRPFRARVISTDPWFDLAVLRVDGSQFAPIRFGDAKQLRKGQIVIALGNPYAIAKDGEVSASWGIISNLLRRAPRIPERSNDSMGRETLHQYGTLIQTDARLNFGYSGGALVNLQGEMVGLTTSYAAAAQYDAAAGFAIPVDEHFLRTVEIMKTGGRPAFGFLGVGSEPLAETLRRKGIFGARVVRLIEGTPAARAGLRTDDVITHVNQQPIYDDDDLFRLIGSLSPGMPATLRVARGDLEGKTFDIMEKTVIVSKKWTNTLRPQIGTAPVKEWRGMQVDYSTAAPSFNQLGPQLDSGGCVYVTDVTGESPAWKAGLRPGVYISHVEHKPVTTPDEFYSAVAGAQGGVDLLVTAGRKRGTRHTVSP